MTNRFFIVFLLVRVVSAHSNLGEPKPTVARSCRTGGVYLQGYNDCAGPCPWRGLNIRDLKFKNMTYSKNPDRIYKRGQTISVKYHRNNHGPGGFVRLTLVPIKFMKSHEKHRQNAFHYSCWGAKAVRATEAEKKVDKYGFSLVGGDGELHNWPVSYYELKATIPTVIPDGIYVFGFLWFGGIGGKIEKNQPRHPFKLGQFTDYWACSFVKIKGGVPLQKRYSPVFKPDVPVWGRHCWSANDGPGICTYEPCKKPARFMNPRPFQNNKKPKDLIRANFN